MKYFERAYKMQAQRSQKFLQSLHKLRKSRARETEAICLLRNKKFKWNQMEPAFSLKHLNGGKNKAKNNSTDTSAFPSTAYDYLRHVQ
jgi:hypothetical protein